MVADVVNAAETRRLTKIFAGRKVLDGVDLEVRAGAIHALLGANGSGKSTTVKLLTGVYQPDSGVIVIGGREVRSIASPRAASSLGVVVVHQEAPFFDTLSVAECIAQFRGYPTQSGRIQWSRLNRDVRAMLERFDLAIDPNTLAARLSAAERALIAIIIALDSARSDVKLLILDEVTATLPRNQAEPYLDRVAALARSGIGVLMVTHHLAELHGRASKATVLRDGAVAYESDASSKKWSARRRFRQRPLAQASARAGSRLCGAKGMRSRQATSHCRSRASKAQLCATCHSTCGAARLSALRASAIAA